MVMLLASLLPIVLWTFIRLGLSGNYAMDPGKREGAFHLFLPHYQKLFNTIALLSFVGEAGSWEVGAQIPMQVFAVSAVYSLLFAGLLLLWYEIYLHNQQSYGRNKYAAILSLGFGSFLLFAMGVVLLAVGLVAGK